MVEGGPRLQASLWAGGLAGGSSGTWPRWPPGGQAAPGLLGAGAATLAGGRRLRLAAADFLGDDLRLIAYPC